MKELDIKLGYNCNNNCLFCLNKDKRPFKHDTEDLKKQIRNSADNRCERLIISGGEPLIYENFFEILLYAKKCKIPLCEIQTNGRALFYEDYVKKIKSIYSNITFLISFHYHTPEMYQKYSQTNGFFQVLKGFENLNNHGLKFTTNTVLFKENIKHLGKILSILDSVNCQYIQFRFIDGKNVLDRFKEFVPKMKDAVEEIKKNIGKYPDKKIYIHEIPFCILGRELIKYSTPEVNEDRENLNIDKTVLNSPDIMKQQFIFPKCENCIYRQQCKGVRRIYANIFGTDEIDPIINND